MCRNISRGVPWANLVVLRHTSATESKAMPETTTIEYVTLVLAALAALGGLVVFWNAIETLVEPPQVFLHVRLWGRRRPRYLRAFWGSCVYESRATGEDLRQRSS